jgi:hypothetical protein
LERTQVLVINKDQRRKLSLLVQSHWGNGSYIGFFIEAQQKYTKPSNAADPDCSDLHSK